LRTLREFGEKYGFIDCTGKTVIEPRFVLTFGFSEGMVAVEIGKKRLERLRM
jgi:hypothetical protein